VYQARVMSAVTDPTVFAEYPGQVSSW